MHDKSETSALNLHDKKKVLNDSNRVNSMGALMQHQLD